MDNKDYIRALLYSYYTTITGWGVLLIDRLQENVGLGVLEFVLGGLEFGGLSK